MLGRELHDMIVNGATPVVTFRPGVADKEGYLEAGMRGRFASVGPVRDDMFKVHVDLAEFDEFNRQFESATYYDKDRVPCLTAREAGFYKGAKETFYVSLDEDVDLSCCVEAPERLQLFAMYKAAGVKMSYVQWLEDRVLGVVS